jgi:cation:H+ antiporter
LTIVGFGTSAPELVVNVLGALNGETDLAFGNIAGSNVANLGLVLGLAALIAPIDIQGNLVRREVPLLLLGTTALTVMALDGVLEGSPPIIGRTDSIVLLLLFGVFVYITALDVIRSKDSDKLLLDIAERSSLSRASHGHLPWIMLVVGGGLLFTGGEMTVRNGSMLAASFGVSSTIIGLFVVAVGTSMPELVTSIIAAMRKESDLALGNVVGSNIFNALFVLPVGGLVAPIPVPDGGIGDLVVSWLFAASLIYFFVVGRARLGRPAGALFLIAYFAYATYRTLSG